MIMIRIGDIAKAFTGYPFDSNLFNTKNGFPLIRIRNLKTGKTDTRYDGKYNLSFIVKKGDLLIGMDGEFNLVEWLTEDALLNQRVMKIVPNENLVLKNYLKFALPKKLKEIEDATPFVTVNHLSHKKVLDSKIPLPDLKTQQNISSILELVDEARQKRIQAIKLTEQFLQSAYVEMFGDPVRNEKGWNLVLFSEVGILNRGISKHRPRNATFLLGGKYPLIQTGEVANCSGYIKKFSHTYSEEGLKQSKLWKEGTLLITIAANIAKTGILTFDSCFPDSIVGFIPNKKTCVEYIQYWISFLQKTLEESAPESAQKNINLDILRKLKLPLPPLSLQQKFASLVEQVEQLRNKQTESEIELDNLFNSLMQKYFG